jgi:phosphoglycerate dehydrogenase-like enzyme
MKLALPEHARPFLDGRLPHDAAVSWIGGGLGGHRQAAAAVPGAEVAWLDILPTSAIGPIVEAADGVRWITTSMAGVNGWPLEMIAARGLTLTNGAGINAKPVADFAVMGVLVMAKNLRELVYAQDRHEYPARAPGVVELDGTRALVIGYGQIGREIGRRLQAFGVDVTGVRRRPDGEAGVIGPNDWRPRLGEFDWIVLASAATRETSRMIGPAELAAMKPSAVIVNIARGDLIDQPALIAAVKGAALAGAFLDVTDPEPAPADDPVWSTPNIVTTSHCSGRSQTGMSARGASLFLENLERYRSGRPLKNQVDLTLGY